MYCQRRSKEKLIVHSLQFCSWKYYQALRYWNPRNFYRMNMTFLLMKIFQFDRNHNSILFLPLYVQHTTKSTTPKTYDKTKTHPVGSFFASKNGISQNVYICPQFSQFSWHSLESVIKNSTEEIILRAWNSQIISLEKRGYYLRLSSSQNQGQLSPQKWRGLSHAM